MDYKKIIFVFFTLICLCFCGCADSTVRYDQIDDLASEFCPVSQTRTGTYRQGILALENGFECTDNGAYFMVFSYGGSWLLYCDHGSDKIIKLCGRPDCKHLDSDCNAFFSTAVNICLYDGYLYTFLNSLSYKGIVKMQLDGTERVNLLDVGEFMSENGYKGIASVKIRNGIFNIGFKKLDSQGNEVAESYYYRLDGSMNKLEETFGVGLVSNDGEAFVGLIGYDSEEEEYLFGKWNAENGIATELYRDKEKLSNSYFAENAMYYIEDGIIYEHSYSGAIKELFDTGLKGNYRLICFPDCLAIDKALESQDILEGATITERILYFYDWNFNFSRKYRNRFFL